MKIPLQILLLLAAPVLAEANGPDPANRLNTDHAPTPFSAEEIREASPSGHFAVFLVEAEGADSFRLVSEFTKVTAEMAEFRGWRESMEGVVIGELMTASATWAELQAHASFPENQTEISEGMVEVPAGSYACWIYSIKGEDGKLKEMAFAKKLPGPPVSMRILANGNVVYSMKLVETGMRTAHDQP